MVRKTYKRPGRKTTLHPKYKMVSGRGNRYSDEIIAWADARGVDLPVHGDAFRTHDPAINQRFENLRMAQEAAGQTSD